jgi:hypothetical protein
MTREAAARQASGGSLGRWHRGRDSGPPPSASLPKNAAEIAPLPNRHPVADLRRTQRTQLASTLVSIVLNALTIMEQKVSCAALFN